LYHPQLPEKLCMDDCRDASALKQCDGACN
jgi:hypothetical protein